MASTVELVRAVCKEKNIPISRIEQELGYGNGYFNPKKVKNIPSDRLAEIARYLDVPVERLLSGSLEENLFENEKKLTADNDDELREMISIFCELNADNRSKLLELCHLFLGDQNKTEEKK